MEDSPRKPRWWLIVTAAILAVVTLFYYTGSWIIVVLFFASFGVFLAWHMMRGKRSSHACIRCGARLNPNARQCDFCGSASWTIRE